VTIDGWNIDDINDASILLSKGEILAGDITNYGSVLVSWNYYGTNIYIIFRSIE